MKSKEPKANMFVWCWLLIFFIVVLFNSCMTAKKAERAFDKFPQVAERKLLNGLPRIIIRDTVTTIEIDSSGFNETIIAARNANEKGKNYIDSLQNRINGLSTEVKEACVDFILINDALTTENKTLNRLMANMKPVRIIERKEYYIEDSLKVKLFRIESERKSDTLTRTKAELKVFKDKEKGNFTLYFPKWLAILILVIGGGAMFTKFKTGGYNPLKLIRK